MRHLSIVLLALFLPVVIRAQCVQSSFSINGQSVSPGACPLQLIDIDNGSSNAVRYEWDFCPGDMTGTPVGTMVTTLSTIQSYDAIRIIKASDTQYYGFVVKQASGGLFRLNYGADLTSVPTVESLGVLGLGGAGDIEFIEEAGIWYALVASGANIIRLKFTAGLGGSSATITSTNLGNFGGLIASARGLALARDGSNFYALVTSSTLNTLTVISFTGSIEGTTSSISIAVPGSSQLLSVNVFKECNTWYGLMTSAGNNRLIKANLGANLMTTSAFQFVTQTGVNIQSFGMDLIVENGQYYAFLATIGNPSTFYQLNFGTSVWSNNPTVINRGSLSGFAACIAMDFFVKNSEVIGFVGNRSNFQLHRVTYPNVCKTNTPSSTLSEPSGVFFNENGSFSIELKAFDNSGNSSFSTKVLVVSAPPVVNFSSDKNCIGSNTKFFDESVSVTSEIVDWSWNFGGLGTSDQQNPEFEFSTVAVHSITLEVTDSRSCVSSLNKNIQIHSNFDIVPDFSFPALICSGGITNFFDESTYTQDEIVAWDWSFNVDEGTSDDQDPVHNFNNPGINDVALTVTGTSGCSYTTTKQINAIEGPALDFSHDGHCEDSAVDFLTEVSVPVTNHHWSFNDGTTSSTENPTHIFSNTGTYSVTLTASNALGCNSSKTKPVIIYTTPSVDFKINPPPLSCSGSPSFFTDLTIDPSDSDVQFWSWNFGDPGPDNTSTLKNPDHTFANAGAYNVSLTATTNLGCSATWEEQVTIAQSPTATIANTSSCLGVPVDFNAIGTDIESYYWEIGTSYYQIPNPVHTFNTMGNHLVELTIVGDNNCGTVYNKIITVPVVLTPDFSVTKNCAGFDAVFTDITTGLDEVIQRSWDFAGQGVATDASPAFAFATAGNKNIKLTVTTQAGCSYTKNKTISIVSPPVAGFSASPESGAVPLNVQFTNTSTGAATYSWVFQDGSGEISSEISPAHAFTTLGEFQVDLTASNSQGCSTSFSKTITTVNPLPDVDLKVINVLENTDGTFKVIITVHNKGNTILQNLPVVIDLSGNASLTETITDPIAPFAQYNLVLSYGLNLDGNLKFLCAQAILENDLAPEGNRICKEFEDRMTFFPVRPNPVRDELNVEWIAPEDQLVNITMIDSFGRNVLSADTGSVEGLNSVRLELGTLKDGIYILRLKGGTILKTQRIVISGQN